MFKLATIISPNKSDMRVNSHVKEYSDYQLQQCGGSLRLVYFCLLQ